MSTKREIGKKDMWEEFKKKTRELNTVIENSTVLDSYASLAKKCPAEHQEFYTKALFGYGGYLLFELRLLTDGVLRTTSQLRTHANFVHKSICGYFPSSQTKIMKLSRADVALRMSRCSVKGIIHDDLSVSVFCALLFLNLFI